MPINKKLDQLLAASGRAEADERRREEDARARRERELTSLVGTSVGSGRTEIV
jgi:hypothetical protein